MGTHRLICHHDTPSRAVSAIVVEVGRTSAGGLDLGFSVAGAHLLELPSVAQPARRDGLWQATCFELFVRPAGGKTYHEYNFAPSGEWAAYTFDDYREGMRDLPLASAPLIVAQAQADRFDLSVTVPPEALLDGLPLIGLNAVIVEEGGARSYWALAHAPEQPDFHHAACFAALLPAPKAS